MVTLSSTWVPNPPKGLAGMTEQGGRGAPLRDSTVERLLVDSHIIQDPITHFKEPNTHSVLVLNLLIVETSLLWTKEQN